MLELLQEFQKVLELKALENKHWGPVIQKQNPKNQHCG
jgi:hypothetical protein